MNNMIRMWHLHMGKLIYNASDFQMILNRNNPAPNSESYPYCRDIFTWTCKVNELIIRGLENLRYIEIHNALVSTCI
jgi:hypothetical protein